MRLRPGPFRRAAGGKVRRWEYYGELEGAIILEGGAAGLCNPSSIHLQSVFNRSSIHHPRPTGGIPHR